MFQCIVEWPKPHLILLKDHHVITDNTINSKWTVSVRDKLNIKKITLNMRTRMMLKSRTTYIKYSITVCPCSVT